MIRPIRKCMADIALLLLLTAGFAEAMPPRVLLLTGSNNHKWKETTPVLKQILEESGTLQVDVVEDPEQLTDGRLAGYDVLLSNWNNYRKNGKNPWSDQLRETYVDFVRNGGGHVVVHAGSSSFSDWKEYQQICLATWKVGQTAHGPRHTFQVRPAAGSAHPLIQGMAPFETTDELWLHIAVQPTASVVAEAFSAADQKKGTGAWEPIALTGRFGQGRCFTLLLGHSAETMNNPGFQDLLQRGTRWAASGHRR